MVRTYTILKNPFYKNKKEPKKFMNTCSLEKVTLLWDKHVRPLKAGISKGQEPF